MISNARGKHSSPGVYMQEIDKTYASKSLGATTLGIVGETLKGPAFEPVHISDWNEFQEYFGGTSTEKFKGTNYPKYEAPYIAKSYLQESKQLEMCRVLGFSGYDAGPAWVIYGETTGTTVQKYPIVVLRSKGKHIKMDGVNTCNPSGNTHDTILFYATGVTMSVLSENTYTSSHCQTNTANAAQASRTTSNTPVSVDSDNIGKFLLTINSVYETNASASTTVAVSLNPSDKNYIVDMLGVKPNDGEYDIFVEEYYDLAHMDAIKRSEPLYNNLKIEKITNINNYKREYSCATTPWFVSDVKGEGNNVEVKKLFRFHTISDGNAANTQIKISIMNILPDEGLFDVVIRDFNDNDNTPVILERYNKCNMIPGTSNYIGLKIGTFNGDYSNKSKYVTVEVIENDTTENCIPCGFLGYPMRKLNGFTNLSLKYNTDLDENIKVNRQYFGMSNMTGVDVDILNFKGVNAYSDKQTTENDGYSNGFHLDVRLNKTHFTGNTVTVDGNTGYTFTTVNTTLLPEIDNPQMARISSESVMEYNIYTDKRLRKFTCYPYGGFDGWDIYREERTNTAEFKANKYKGILYEDTSYLKDVTPYTALTESYYNSNGSIVSDTGDTYTNYRANLYALENGKEYILTQCDTTQPIYIFQKTNNAYVLTSTVSNKKEHTIKCTEDNIYVQLIYIATGNCTAVKCQIKKDDIKQPFTNKFDYSNYNLKGKVINSDYYAYLAGYKQFENPSKVNINLLATPGIDYVNNLELVNEVLDIVEETRQGDCLYVVTTPDTDKDGHEIDAEDAVANFENSELNTSYAATYYPWVKYYDAANKKYINLPATKDVVRNFAYTDNISQPWFASAGMSRGSVDCVKATHFTKLDEEDILYEGMINPIKSFSADGVKIWGNKTMYLEDTPLNRINVRRLMIRVKDLIMKASRQLIFEQNDNTVEKQFRSIVDPILADAKQKRGISDYKIVTDTSAEARDRKELPASIHVKPINCLEYIPITFTIYPEGAQFEE